MNAARGAAGDQQSPRRVDVRIIGADRESDLALLKIDAVGLPVLPFAPVDAVRQGDLVLAIGNPMGLRNSVSLGVVSAVFRSVNGNSPVSYIQTDASINPGNSVGINTFVLTQSGETKVWASPSPTNVVQDVVRQLRDKAMSTAAKWVCGWKISRRQGRPPDRGHPDLGQRHPRRQTVARGSSRATPLTRPDQNAGGVCE